MKIKLNRRFLGKRLAAAKPQQKDAIRADELNNKSTLRQGTKAPSTRPVVYLMKYEKTKRSHIVIPNFLYFPLPADGLLTLLQFNVCRATHLNLALLAPYAAQPTPNLHPLPPDLKQSLPPTMPPTLEPTALQRRIKHPAWIDAVPLPQLRHNIIEAYVADTFDFEPLCADLFSMPRDLRGCGAPADPGEHRGVMVWADPWEISGWEISEAFAREWGCMLKGCGEFVEATNSWRRKRGEKELVIEV